MNISLEDERSLITDDLCSGVADLPGDYQLLVGWDPERSEDVGWITLKKGVVLDFNHFQLRDYNLHVGTSSLTNEEEQGSRIFKTNSVNVKSKMFLGVSGVEDDNRACVDKEIVRHVIDARLKSSSETSSIKKDTSRIGADYSDQNNNSETKEDGESGIINNCPYCNHRVRNLSMHMTKCKSINSRNKHRVKCPMCSYRVRSRGLSSHIKIHFTPKSTCLKCGVIVREDGYEQHLERCRLRTRPVTIPCSVCSKSFSSLVLVSSHMETEHPDLSPSALLDERSLEKYKEWVEVAANNKESECKEKEFRQRNSKIWGEVLRGERCESVNSGRGMAVLGDLIPIEKAICLIKFVMKTDGKMLTKTIKTSMTDPVEKAIKMFLSKRAKVLGYADEDFEFKSNDIVLSGEELAGSIDKGLVQVSVKTVEAKDATADIDMKKEYKSKGYAGDGPTTAWYMSHDSSWTEDRMIASAPGDYTSYEAMERDTEELDMEMNIEQTEHVVLFSQF